MGKDKRKELLIILFSLIILIVSIVIKSDRLLPGVLLIWSMMVLYTVTDVCNHIALLFYLISFFVFLIGREVCFSYGGLKRYYTYLEPYNRITFLLLIISLVFILLGYVCEENQHKFTSLFKKENRIKPEKSDNSDMRMYYSTTCKIFFYICYTVSIISVLIQIIHIKNDGYLALYISKDNIIPPVFSYMTAFSSIALCLYLATNPVKKSAICVLVLYEIYAVLELFAGHRYTFIAINMTIIIYMCIRNRIEGGWIKKRYIIAVLVTAPFLIVLLLALDSIRVGGEFVFEGGGKSLMMFLDQQGGSINVIKRIFYYKDKIDDLHFTAFGNLRSVLFENALVRNIFDIKVYTGNSVEHALHGHSLAHRLSYLEYGNSYLQGHGVGSCYIAELYHDFGMIGVISGNFFYGYVLRKINSIQLDNCLKDGILIIMIYYLMLAPRGNFDGFIGGIFSLYSIFGFILICIISRFMTWVMPKIKDRDER